jgi:hypothetical protein
MILKKDGMRRAEETSSQRKFLMGVEKTEWKKGLNQYADRRDKYQLILHTRSSLQFEKDYVLRGLSNTH